MAGEFLKILNEITSNFTKRDRQIILQMDEVHIRSDLCYKGDRVLGSIENTRDPRITIFANICFKFDEKTQKL